MQEPRLSSTCT